MIMCRIIVHCWSACRCGRRPSIAPSRCRQSPREEDGRTVKPVQQPEPLGDELVTRDAVCRWAEEPPVLDGKLDDRCWQKAAVIDQFRHLLDGPKTSATGHLRLPRLGRRCTLLRRLDDRRRAPLVRHPAKRLALERRRLRAVLQAECRAARSITSSRPIPAESSSRSPFPRRGHQFTEGFTNAPLLGNKAVVALNGTLDQPGDKDESWTVEGRIPWSAFAPSGGKPKPGEEWLFAFCRYDYGPKGTDPVLMSSAPLTRSGFHRHEDYGKLRFEGPPQKDRP